MLDKPLQTALTPALRWLATGLLRAGWTANRLTVAGFIVGLGGAWAISQQAFLLGWVLILTSRLLDGLDGAAARLTQPTERGAFLDITLDFLFYASIPLAFAWADPARNALAAATLLACFIGTGSSFLAFAALLGPPGQRPASPTRPAASPLPKGLVMLGGLTEASETLIAFSLMCLWPEHFATWAYGFAAMCAFTIVTRLLTGWRTLSGAAGSNHNEPEETSS
jgi:phosphatidylglycerophosphate synthase